MFSQSVGGQFIQTALCVLQTHVRRPLSSPLFHGEDGRLCAQLPCETPALGIAAVLPDVYNLFMRFNRNDTDVCWSSYCNKLRRTQTNPQARQWNNAGNSNPNFN